MADFISKNHLLNRAPVGHTKIVTMDLPENPNHTYGKQNRKDDFNAGHLLTSWNFHQT